MDREKKKSKYSSLLRSNEEVMNIHRLGAMHQSRISFARSIIRKIKACNWKIATVRWDLSEQGIGLVMYQIKTSNNIYHLVIFSNSILDEERNDRVIAEKWDITFALVQGNVTPTFLKELQHHVPLQEKGRTNNNVLVLSRANKSVRIFDHILDNLSKGKQPSKKLLAEVGYILRTTAVYGNGKFGIADFSVLNKNSDFNLSFSAQMFSVYLLRQFSLDWIHFLAKQRGGVKATTLDVNLQRYLGVGNATGLGMSLFLIRHPLVVNNWILQRERALTKVLKKKIIPKSYTQMQKMLLKAQKHLQEIITIDEQQKKLNRTAIKELSKTMAYLEKSKNKGISWKEIIYLNRMFSYETQEVFISCLLELYPKLVDSYETEMNCEEKFIFIDKVKIEDFAKSIETNYRWAIEADFTQPGMEHFFWYISEDKEEPRLGVRGVDEGDDLELPLDIMRQVNKLYQLLKNYPPTAFLTEFLLDYPEYTSIAKRVWTIGKCHLGEIQVNILNKYFLPINLLRCKLAILGATKFDPRSDKWVRVTFFQNAPLLNEPSDGSEFFPVLQKQVHL